MKIIILFVSVVLWSSGRDNSFESLGFCRGSRVEGTMSRVLCRGSRVLGYVEGIKK